MKGILERSCRSCQQMLGMSQCKGKLDNAVRVVYIHLLPGGLRPRACGVSRESNGDIRMENEFIDFMSQITMDAGKKLLVYFKNDKELISMRSTAKEAATRYDLIIDKFLIERIRRRYPDHSLLTEESGRFKGDPEMLWVIDSLDGTGNFANQNPLFSICIAFLRKGIPEAGVVYAPAIGEFYSASKGLGAYLNGKRIAVSDVGDLSESYSLYCEGGDTDRERTGGLLTGAYREVKDIRKLGTAGLETAWVASGRCETYFTTGIDPWDVAPGVILVKEAGGRVSDFYGNEWECRRSDLLFSNSAVHSRMLEILKQG